ncbi:MAG: LamG-like jellyroll fold domain-containing protein, partial [Opitutae bacterium]
ATNQPVPLIWSNNQNLAYYLNGANRIIGTTTLPLNQWMHIAVSRAGGITRLFLNGTQEGSSYTDAAVYTSNANRPIIGVLENINYASSTPGYIDDLRITKGVARYTSNFIPPGPAPTY